VRGAVTVGLVLVPLPTSHSEAADLPHSVVATA
jgi:hypothetical protein